MSSSSPPSHPSEPFHAGHPSESTPQTTDPIPHSSPVLAVHQFSAENDDELAFEVGERLIVIEKDEVYGDGWWRGRSSSGAEGLFPASYVQAISPSSSSPSQPPANSTSQSQSQSHPPTSTSANGNHANGLSSLAAAAGITSLQSNEKNISPLVPGGGTAVDAGENEVKTEIKGDVKDEAPTTPGGTVMKDTIGDIDKAIHSMGKGSVISSTSSPVADGGKKSVKDMKNGGKTGGNEADDEGLDQHGHGLSSDEDDLANPIWGGSWGSGGVGGGVGGGGGGETSKFTRSRLAEQARVENERKEREEREERGRSGSVVARETEKEMTGVRSSGVPAGLVYSDESDDEEENHRKSGVQTVKDQIASASNSPVVAETSQLPPITTTTTTTTATTPIPIANTDEKKSDQSLSGQVLAAAATAAVGVGAVLGTGIHAAAQAAGIESPLPTSATPVEQPQGIRNVGALSAPIELVSTQPPVAVGSGEARRVSNGDAVESPMGTRDAMFGSSAVSAAAQPTTMGDNGVKGWAVVPGNPADWTVEQVQTWARGKGFDEVIVGKFEEHEITGDVLIELDANLLKELDIPQFGKRVKLANAIAELRRPASQGSNSVRSSQHLGAGQTGRGFAMLSGGASGQYAYSEGQQSATQSPVTGGPTSSYPTSPNVAFPYQESYRRPYASTPPMEQRDSDPPALAQNDSRRASDVTSNALPQDAAGQVNGTPTAGLIAAGAGVGAVGATAAYAEWSHPHIRQPSQSLAKSPIQEEEEAGPAAQNAKQASTAENSREGTPVGNSDSIRSHTSSIPVSPSATSSVAKRSSGGGHKKGKASLDGGKAPSERMSFLGGALGRNRKPAPRYPSSASTVVQNDRDEKSGHERSRSLKGLISGPGKQGSKSSTATSEVASKRLSTASPEGEDHPMRNSPGVAQSTAISQIGKPDFAGYMKKRGERYNTWKNRYFVLKGPHLYYMKDENESHVKGHIDLAGYKVMTEANSNPGGHGFQIVHEREKAHYFSSNDYRVVKDWMKNIMKATITRDYSAPVVSSCNIPTIPLREAQMMSPGPRPPSPSERDATQRAARRENPNQLTARDASVLMSFDNTSTSPRSPKSPRRSSALARQTSPNSLPPRPSRDMRKPSDANIRGSGAIPRKDSDASFYPQSNVGLAPPLSPSRSTATAVVPAAYTPHVDDGLLLSWINSHLPPSATPATSIPSSFISGRIITRVIEHISGPSLTPPPPASDDIFIPMASGDANIDGLFMMMDRCIDEGVNTVGVSINDVRLGHGEEIRKLLESLKRWGEAKA